jgi:hypothetical protein
MLGPSGCRPSQQTCACVEFNHFGEVYNFDVFLGKYTLNDPVLQDLAAIVRAADIECPDLIPQSPGLCLTRPIAGRNEQRAAAAYPGAARYHTNITMRGFR